VLDWVQIDNNFSEFVDSITLRRIQENNSAGHGGEQQERSQRYLQSLYQFTPNPAHHPVPAATRPVN
ncbi:hypothetical protein KUCAC02_008037, partial [Chaenocephalus aceratus]